VCVLKLSWPSTAEYRMMEFKNKTKKQCVAKSTHLLYFLRSYLRAALTLPSLPMRRRLFLYLTMKLTSHTDAQPLASRAFGSLQPYGLAGDLGRI